MLPDSRVVDAPPHKVAPEQVIEMAEDYEFLVPFTSTPGFANARALAESMKEFNPNLEMSFDGSHVGVRTEDSLRTCQAIDFVVRKEFGH